MNHASQNSAPLGFAGSPWPMFLLAFGTVLINAGFLAAYWWMTRLSQEQQWHSAQETHEFHKQFLGDLKQLIDQSPVQATEDLCQVRFRFRFPDGVQVPLTPMEVQLFQREENQGIHLVQLHDRWTTQPVLNFGFLPPGTYRLSLKNSLGMHCDHDFRVMPGVPVDRVDYCPRPCEWHQRKPPFALRIQPVWPIEWDSEPIVAVYHLQAGGQKVEGWAWQAPEAKQFHQWVVAGNLRGPFSETAFCDVLPDALFEKALPPELEVLPHGAILIPYGCCELTAISFVLDKTHKQQGYVYLGTCRFAEGQVRSDLVKTGSGDDETWLPEAAPLWEIDAQPSEGFPIQIPRPMIRQVADRARLRLGEQSPPVTGMPRARPFGLRDPSVTKLIEPTNRGLASSSASL